MSPTQRTLKWLRDRGCYAEVVERWNSHAKVRHDLFGCIDILALTPTLVGIQVTTTAHLPDRRRKILDLYKTNGPVRAWISHVGHILLVGWSKKRKIKKDGKKGKSWVYCITMQPAFDSVPLDPESLMKPI